MKRFYNNININLCIRNMEMRTIVDFCFHMKFMTLLHSTRVRTSIDLVRSKVLPVIKIQVDVEEVSMW